MGGVSSRSVEYKTDLWVQRRYRTDLRQDGEGGIRTRDTTIFSRVLYQLSYLAWSARNGLRSGKASGPAWGVADCMES